MQEARRRLAGGAVIHDRLFGLVRGRRKTSNKLSPPNKEQTADSCNKAPPGGTARQRDAQKHYIGEDTATFPRENAPPRESGRSGVIIVQQQ